MSSVDDPVLKELLDAFRQDVRKLADDVVRGMWIQAAISVVAFFLALSSVVRLLVELYYRVPGPFGGPSRVVVQNLPVLVPEIVLDTVLFGLSIYAFRSYLMLRSRYSRLWVLTDRLGK